MNFKYADTIDLLQSFFSNSEKKEVLQKFCAELHYPGFNVRADCKKYGVTPHYFDSAMSNFYLKTNSFIFELSASSLKQDKIEKDNYILNYVSSNLEPGKNILCFGDGIGTDSINFTKSGHHVTYFDIEGATTDFAKFRFSKESINNKITLCHDQKLLKEDCYDVIICREVLEHIDDPFQTVDLLYKKLKSNGLCFLSESFSRVVPQFPTHLKKNLIYAGRTVEIMVGKGFIFLESYENTRLYVFKKTDLENKKRFDSIPKSSKLFKIKKHLKALINEILS